MRLLLIRHGESVGNVERRLQGQHEFPLTARGIEQSRRLAQRLSACPLAALYSSPVQRALATANILGETLKLPVVPLPAVQEYDFGELAGLTWLEIRERAPEVVEAIRAGSPEYPRYPGEEGRDNFRRRVRQGLWELAEKHQDDTVAVVTHAGPIVVFCLDLLKLPYRRPIPFALDNASLTLIDILDGRGVIMALNDTCHLRDAPPEDEPWHTGE